jgi:hypothetical protein
MRISGVWITALLLSAFCGGGVQAQAPETKETQASESKGMPARANASEYQAQATAGSVTIGAEFAGHSVPKPEGPLSSEEFIVVEAGLFGAPGAKLALATNDFSLRINGKKAALASVPYGMVSGSLKDPEWAPPETEEVKKSKTGLSTGAGGDSTPPVVHVPLELRRAMALYLQKASLPEGERPLPQAGLLYFRYGAKVKSIHSIELMYSGPAGNATLTLQP